MDTATIFFIRNKIDSPKLYLYSNSKPYVMKVFNSLVISFVSLLFTTGVFAQEFQVPENVSFNTKEDYVRTEKDIIEAAKWLESTQMGKEMDKRVKANAFVLMWVTGSPTVTIEIGKLCTDLSEKNSHLLAVFLASYCRYVLENNYNNDILKANTAAIKSMINCYSLGGDVKKNKLIEKAIAADKDGKLEEWVKENMQ